MNTLVSQPPRSPRRDSMASLLDGLWRDYLSARDAAERTRNIQDGIAAGQAWRNWLSAFASVPAADELATAVPHGNG